MPNGWWILPALILSVCFWASLVLADTIIITYNMGGPIAEQVVLVNQLRASGTTVIIDGKCASACTMFLGVPRSCVTPGARLGFHGPSTQYAGISLPPADFDYWSGIMASNYPPKIRTQFMHNWRYATTHITWLTGAQASMMGVRLCYIRKH